MRLKTSPAAKVARVGRVRDAHDHEAGSWIGQLWRGARDRLLDDHSALQI